jgi:hypothetical protein
MILFFQNGRLGNQILQYYGLKKYFSSHKIIIFGCKELKNLFDNIEANFFLKENYFGGKFRVNILKILFLFLVKARVIGRITQSRSLRFNLSISRGILFNIFFLDSVYFQHQDCVKDLNSQITIKKKILLSAKNWFKKKNFLLNKNRLVFVHIRRDDFIHGPLKKFPSVLDLSWYQKAMILMSKKISKPVFILMGNDKFYMRDIFKESKSLIISDNSIEIDFALMSMCSHGILSASTIAWCGAFFAKTKKSNNMPSYFFAPKFWMGHRLKKWYPSNFFSEWITYLK